MEEREKDEGRKISHRQRAQMSIMAVRRKKGRKRIHQAVMMDEMLQRTGRWEPEGIKVRNRKVG
jgi:hypothetical protein